MSQGFTRNKVIIKGPLGPNKGIDSVSVTLSRDEPPVEVVITPGIFPVSVGNDPEHPLTVVGEISASITQIGTALLQLGQAVMAASIPVTIASDQSPLKVDPSAVTSPVDVIDRALRLVGHVTPDEQAGVGIGAAADTEALDGGSGANAASAIAILKRLRTFADRQQDLLEQIAQESRRQTALLRLLVQNAVDEVPDELADDSDAA
jgi:hypothetical protein